MAAFGIQLLEKGLALCGRNFQGFVDAWNHVVNRSAHIRGDGDTDPENGLITVDNSNVDHPVIRLDRSKLKADGSSGASAADLSASAFGLVEEKDESGTVTGRTVVNCWWNQGGVTRTGADVSIGTSEGVVYLKIAATGQGGSGFEVAVGTLEGVQSMQQDPSLYVVPLYSISGGSVVDLRTAPQLQMVEFLTQ